VLAALAALGPGVTGAVELLGQVHDLAGFADQIQGELARLAAALDAADGASEAGYSSTAAFLRHACGRLPGRAGELVATGRALRALAATGKALIAGQISFDAAHMICRTATEIADPGLARVAEEQMLALARFPEPEPEGPAAGPGTEPDSSQPDSGQPDDGQPDADGTDPGPGKTPGQPAGPGPGRGWAPPVLDPGQLRRLGEELIYRADPDAAEERERKRFERRHLSFGLTLDHAGTLSGACGDTLSAEIIKTAVHAFGPPLGTEDTRTAAQRRMDGLTAACQAALDSGTAGTRHGAAPHLSIMVDEHTLAHRTGTTETTGTGPTSPAGTTATGTTATGTGTTGPAGSCTTAPQTGQPAGTSRTTRPSPDGTSPAGTSPDGTSPDGSSPDGTSPDGTSPDRTSTPGTPCTCTSGTPAPSDPTAPGGMGGTGGPPAAWPGPPPARTGYGAMLTARQVLALACRADLSVIRWSDGIPLDVGRRYRTETPAIRRALEARDQGCRFTGCGMPAVWTTAHHLRPWSEGGTTSLNDTALLCFVHHHYHIHLLGWTITGNPNTTLRFTHPSKYLTLDSPLPSQTKPRAP
jgi:hypothetical protein